LLGIILGVVEARRISQPLVILAQRLRRAVATHSAAPVAIADDGEVGGVAAAAQELLDSAYGPGRTAGGVPLSQAFAQSSFPPPDEQ
jgi:hypothetical protein